MKFSTLSVALAAGAVSVRAALPTISVTGNKFFTKSGSQFYIKGVAYQLSPDDPLIDGDQCALDAALMKTLGVNTIRVYHVDASADHSSCMSAFEDAGIYALIDMDTFDSYILDPTMSGPSWTQTQFDKYAAVMDAFVGFNNVLGFYIGNEDISSETQSLAAPYIKAATTDMKAYRDKQNYREIPIGYSAADIAQLRPMLQNYLTCGGNDSNIIDFFSLNSYEWCDPSTYTQSGYANLQAQAVDFPVPIFFSETGCNVPGPRLFDDQAAIFGPEMVDTWSGAIIYEWIQEANNYGLITYGDGAASDDAPRSGTPTPMTPDFANLKTQWATLNPTGVSLADYNGKNVETRACPTSTAGGWLVNGNVALPTLGSDALNSPPKGTTGAATTATKTASRSSTSTGKGASAKVTDSDTQTGAATATPVGTGSEAAATDATATTVTTGKSTATGTAEGSAASSDTPSKSSAASLSAKGLGLFNREFTAAGAALVGVTAIFTLWL